MLNGISQTLEFKYHMLSFIGEMPITNKEQNKRWIFLKWEEGQEVKREQRNGMKNLTTVRDTLP